MSKATKRIEQLEVQLANANARHDRATKHVARLVASNDERRHREAEHAKFNREMERRKVELKAQAEAEAERKARIERYRKGELRVSDAESLTFTSSPAKADTATLTFRLGVDEAKALREHVDGPARFNAAIQYANGAADNHSNDYGEMWRRMLGRVTTVPRSYITDKFI